MQDAADAVPSGMVSILGLEREQGRSALRRGPRRRDAGNRQPALPGQHRRLGRQGGLRADRRTLATAAGAMKVIPLAVAGAFHTPLMQPAVERLRAALADVPLQKPRIPVISNVDARPHDDPDEIRELLDPASLLAGPLGRLDALPARRRQKSRSFTKSAPAACCAGLLEAHRPQGAVRKHRGVIASTKTFLTHRGSTEFTG